MTGPNSWKPDGFRSKLDDWRDRADPPEDLYRIAKLWAEAREQGTNPLQGARRRQQESMFLPQDNGVEDGTYWRAHVASTDDGGWLMCDFQVFRDGRVICEEYGILDRQ